MKKIIKNIVITISVILVAYILYLLITIAFYHITHPRMSLNDLNESINHKVISAKQIETYLISKIQENDKRSKYELTIGSINMKVDKAHRGKVTVIFVEKHNNNSKVIYAYLDTQENIFYKFEDFGRESKLYLGIINLKNWKIDSTEAVEISEEFFEDTKDFRYDEIWITTTYISDSKELWNIYLTDKTKNIRYCIDLNPYSGEVINYTID